MKETNGYVGRLSVIPTDRDNYQNRSLKDGGDIGLTLQSNKFTKGVTNYTVQGVENGKVNLISILNHIPAIQIREYTQDTRVDFILDMAKIFIEGIQDGEKAAGEIKLTSDQTKNIAHLMIHDVRNPKSKLWSDVIKAFEKSITIDTKDYLASVDDKKILIDLAYTLYYRILSTTTTNRYVLPFNSNEIQKGNGDIGWEQNIFEGNILSKAGFIGDFLSKSINLTTTPIWQGMKGSEGYTLDFSVNLFNDSVDSALMNYIFINTIIPQNLPTNYLVFQQPPSVYDLKIEGFNRLFMCSGKFTCNYKGVLRVPSQQFIDKLSGHVNINVVKKDFVNNLIKNNLIKIPDVYELHLSFKSLLPNTFNNFIFQYAFNSDITLDNSSVQDGWVTNTGVKGAITDWGKNRTEDGKEMTYELDSVEQDYLEKVSKSQNLEQFEQADDEYEDKKEEIYYIYENFRNEDK